MSPPYVVGKTALLEAVEDGATDTVSFLVAQGASPNHETKAEGVTAVRERLLLLLLLFVVVGLCHVHTHTPIWL